MDWSDILYYGFLAWGISFMFGALLGMIFFMTGKFDNDNDNEEAIGYWFGICLIPLANSFWAIYWLIRFIIDAVKYFNKTF